MPEPPLPASFLPFAALLSQEAGELLQLDAPLWLTRAPGRMELLGGPAENPGTATLTVPMGRAIYCAIQNREDQEIVIKSLLPKSWGGTRMWKGDTGTLYTRKGPPRSLQVLKQTFAEEEDAWMLRVVAAMLGLRRTRQLNTPKHGFNMIIWSRLPEGDGYGHQAAFGTAVSLALKGATGLAQKRVDGLQVARAVVQGAFEVLDEVIPMASALTSALGRRSCALLVEHGVDPNMQWIPLPKQCEVATFDTGVMHPLPPERRDNVVTGSNMALAHLNAAQKKAKEPAYGGWGQIAPSDFEGGLRDHVPTKETGADWLKRFRLPEPEVAEVVNAEHGYRERALAEHHVRETARVKRFVSQMTEYARTLREGFLVEAGRCLLSSQRSFSEKCNVAYDESDEFLTMLKARGRAEGLFGARLTDCGSTGVMVTLCHQSGMQNLRDLATDYAKKHKGGGVVTSDTGDGGVLTGWWEGVLEVAEVVESAEGEEAKDGGAASKAEAKEKPAAKPAAEKATKAKVTKKKAKAKVTKKKAKAKTKATASKARASKTK